MWAYALGRIPACACFFLYILNVHYYSKDMLKNKVML